MSRVHAIINQERNKRGLKHVFWSREMARLAQSQAEYCAKVGHLVHSNRYAYQGGENLAQGGRYFSPRAIVNCWLRSKAGHREYLLSRTITKAGIGISRAKGKTYVAWAFSDQPPSYPDCPGYRKQHSSDNPIKYSAKRGSKTLILSIIILVVIIIISLKLFGLI